MELWLHRSRPHRSDRENLVRSHAHPILGFAEPRSVSWRQASNQFVSQPRPATEPDRSCLATHDESYVPRPREIWPAAPDRGSAQVGLPAPADLFQPDQPPILWTLRRLQFFRAGQENNRTI